MFNRTAIRQSIACIAIALTFQLTTADSVSASGLLTESHPHVGPASPAGAVAMLRLRVPTGGQEAASQTSFALMAGPVWRGDPTFPISPRFDNYFAVEMGLTLAGQLVAKLGGMDLLNMQPPGLHADGESDGKGARLLIGAIVLGAAVWGLSYVWLQNKCNNNSCTNGVSVTN